jgi:hypothetical protein
MLQFKKTGRMAVGKLYLVEIFLKAQLLNPN